MAISFLIDTCILRRLISYRDFSRDLQQLSFWVKNKHIVLLSPEILRNEWLKHREEEKRIILKNLKQYETELRVRQTIHDPGTAFFKEDLDELKTILLSQLDLIDELLDKWSYSFTVSQERALKIYEMQKGKKAPFQNPRKNNQNDAELLFSSVDFLQENGEASIYFVSDNTTDFAAGEKSNLQLHPDILALFPGFSFNYYSDIRDAFKTLVNLGLPRWEKTKQKEWHKIHNVISVDKSKSILNQLHEYLTTRFGHLIILPKRLFTEHYPFIKEDYFQYGHSPFTLITDNEEVYDLLTGIRFEKEQLTAESEKFILSEDDRRKIMEVFLYLRQNFLYQISLKNKKDVQLSFPIKKQICSCSLCLYRNLKISDLLKKTDHFLTITDNKIAVEQRLRLAYGFYKIRDFVTAAKLMELLKHEVKDAKDITYYILCFNLKHLGTLINHSYWDHPEIGEWAKEFQFIDLSEIYKQCRTLENNDILKWIHEKEFFNSTYMMMQDTVGRIRDLYYSKSSGHDQSTRNLLEQYYVIESFLNQNSIVFDTFSEFESLTVLFTEGLIASHNWSHSMGGKLLYFDDFALEKFLLYGKAEIIKKYFNRYKLKALHYKEAVDDYISVMDRLTHFIESHSSIKEAYEQMQEIQNPSFWREVSDILCNGLVLLGMVDNGNQKMDEIAKKLITLLGNNDHFHLYALSKEIRFFLFKKHEYLSEQVIKSFFVFALQQETFIRDEQYFELLKDILEIKKSKLNFSEEDFTLIKKNFLIEPGQGKEASWVILGHIFQTLESDSQRKQITDFALKRLKRIFDGSHYYFACMLLMIDPSEIFTSQYIEEIELLARKGQQPQFLQRHEFYSDNRVTQFFNFCFAYHIQIPDPVKNSLRELSEYYSWLLNMDSFDYKNFNVEWLTDHFTIYFKEAFKKSQSLKSFLLEHIKQNTNTELEKTFMLIYCYED